MHYAMQTVSYPSEPVMPEPHQQDIDHSFTSNELVDRLSPLIEQLFRVYGPTINAFATKVVPQIVEHIVHIPKNWAAYVARIDALTVESKQAMQLALDKGWFFGWVTSLEEVISLVEGIKTLRPDQMDDHLSAYFRKNFDCFVSQLVERYPVRGQAISAAARAHKDLGEDGFYLSTPVFIAQSDGLLSDILRVESPLGIPRAVKGQPKVRLTTAGHLLKQRFESDQKSLTLLHPFFTLHESYFLKSSKARRPEPSSSVAVFTALNRHQVMHGESSDYGTEVNSLKAFSLLVFVGLHLQSICTDQDIMR